MITIFQLFWEPHLTGFNFSSLQQRVFSAVVMIPVVLGVIYFGGLPFLLMVLSFTAMAFYEWTKLALKTDKPYMFLFAGGAYIFFCMWCCYQIRAWLGVEVAFLFVIMVWASDIGAYFTGKTLGGPKLAKDISPNKTWSGYAAALLFPGVFGGIYTVIVDFSNLQPVSPVWLVIASVFLMAGALIGIAGQAGDLLVSWFKRRANVKDTGDIIPGHGGVLDRIDSMLLCAPVFLGFMYVYSMWAMTGAHG